MARGVLAVLPLSLMTPLDAVGQAVSIREVQQIMVGPSPLDTFRRPCGMVADPEHDVLAIADTGNNRVVFLDSRGRSRGALHWTLDTEEGRKVGEPRCVALDQRGRLYAVDVLSNEVEVMTTTGSHLAYLDLELAKDLGEPIKTQFIAVGSSGRIHVLCTGQRSGLVIFEKNGMRSGSLVFESTTSLWTPVAFAIHPDETRLALVDPEAPHQVKILSMAGELLSSFGPHGEGQGTFSMAVHVTWGPKETLWVTDTIRHSISIFDQAGTFLGRIGGYGTAPGQFNYPSACAFLSEDRLAVLERAGGRCQVLELDLQLPDILEAQRQDDGSGVKDVEPFTTGGR